jgi:ArsR family transcriptional regulator
VLDQPDDLRALRVMHKTLADVNRLRIIQRLARGDASVTDLIAEVGLSQPLVSWHVRSLRVAGLVDTRRKGRETLVRLRADAWEAFVERERTILGLSSATAS